MLKSMILVPATALVLFAVPALAQEQVAAPTALKGALLGSDGGDKGTVTVAAAPNGVFVRVEAKGLTPGWHAMHFHEKGACSDDKFASAGGHVHTMTPVVHGLMNKDANDAGDLPNIFVGADGTVTVEVYSSLVTATKVDSRPYLMDADGSAVVIHDMPDDYASQPIGNAGGRAACAALK